MDINIKIKDAVGWLLPCVAAFFVVILFLKAGRLPAASSGDEVWWSEAGYWLIHRGTLSWAVFDDPYGSGVKSFWPPLVALIQALNIKIFGLTPFGIQVQSPILATLTGLGVFLLGKSFNYTRSWCYAAAIAVLGFTSVDLRIGRVRMENLAMFLFVLSLIFIWNAVKSRVDSRKGRAALFGVAGLCVGLSCMAYYPQAPFYLAGGLLGVFLLWYWDVMKINELVCFLFGGLLVFLSALVWIYPDFDQFFKQLNAGAELRQTTSALHLNPISRGAGLLDILSVVELFFVTICIVIAIKLAKSRAEKAVFFACLPPCFVWILYSTPGMAMGAFAIAPLALIQIIREARNLYLKRSAMVAVFALILAAIGLQVLGGQALALQWTSRDYNYVTRSVDALDLGTGKIGISQSAWLALRAKTNYDQLHVMQTEASGLAYANRSRVLRDPANLHEFSAFIFDQEAVESLRKDYALFDRAISSGEFEVIGVICPDFTPAIRAPKGPYNLVVYGRRNKGVQGR